MSFACRQTSTPQTNEVVDVAISARIEVYTGAGQDVGGSSLATLVPVAREEEGAAQSAVPCAGFDLIGRSSDEMQRNEA